MPDPKTNPFPAIPDPGNDLASLRAAVKQLRACVLILTGQMESSGASAAALQGDTDVSFKSVLATGSSQLRTLATRAGETINLRDFGAVGDNVADDTDAVNRWWYQLCKTGYNAHIPAGTYKVSGARLSLDFNVAGSNRSRLGGVIFGDGGQRSVFNVMGCTGSPQFLLQDTSGAAFYWTLRDFGIRCNIAGVGAQVMRDWNGSAFPDFANSFSLTGIVVQNGHASATCAMRINGLLESEIDIVANCGGAGVGNAFELEALQFCRGSLAAGNAGTGLHFGRVSFGNELLVDVEVVNHCVVANGGSTRNRIGGVFVWGATNANPAISGNDGTTDCIVMTAAGGPFVFTNAAQFGVAGGVPQVTGAASGLAAFENRTQGTWDVGALRISRPPGLPALINMDSETAQSIQMQFRRNGGLRWLLVRDTTAEGGSDAGSLLVIQAYSDAGAFLANVAVFNRDNGGLVTAPNLRATAQFRVPAYTVGTLPSAALAGQVAYVSDESGGAVLAFTDGANWRRVTDRAIVS
jgi:hypothetical protein